MVQQRNRAAVCASWCWLRDIEEQAVSRIECSEREEECLRGEGQSWKRKGEDVFALSLSLSFTFPLPFVSFPFPSPSLPSFPFPFPSLLTLVSFHAHPTDVFSSIHISNEKIASFRQKSKRIVIIHYFWTISFFSLNIISFYTSSSPALTSVCQSRVPTGSLMFTLILDVFFLFKQFLSFFLIFQIILYRYNECRSASEPHAIQCYAARES